MDELTGYRRVHCSSDNNETKPQKCYAIYLRASFCSHNVGRWCLLGVVVSVWLFDRHDWVASHALRLVVLLPKKQP